MKLEVTEGCIAYSYEVDGKEWIYLTNEERRDILLRIIQSQNDFNNCQSVFTSLVQEFGKYEYLGNCDQCGDCITRHTLEI